MSIAQAAGKATGTRHPFRRALTVAIAVLAMVTGALAAAPAAQAYPPYGPYTCANSLVWREATAGDQVCVTPGRRALTWKENAEAASHVEPDGHTCKPGYVWRETRPSDHVCVTPDIRHWAMQDNVKAVCCYASIPDLPANGTSSRWDVVDGQMWVSGSSFTPGRTVSVYGWAPDTQSFIRQRDRLAWGRADGGGWLTLALTPKDCSLSPYRGMYILTVDEATGLVRRHDSPPKKWAPAHR